MKEKLRLDTHSSQQYARNPSGPAVVVFLLSENTNYGTVQYLDKNTKR